MKLSTSVFCLFLILVTGCAQSAKAIAQPVTPLATPSPFAKIPISPTAVGTVPTSSTHLPVEVSLENECIPVEDKIPDDLVLSGVWVRSQNKPYLENLEAHIKYEVPLKGGGGLVNISAYFYISPDGKHLAYLDPYLYVDDKFRTNKLILRIINSSGHSLSMDFWTVSWQWIIGWVDNQNLAISVSNSMSNNDVIILNPFTGSWKRFEPPQWLKFDDTYYWSLPYSPTLEWAWDAEQQHLVLKDIKAGGTIWESGDQGGFPLWSRDGSTLAMISGSHINLISKTDQTVQFDIRKLRLDSLSSWDVALSSDGKKLFFGVASPEKFVFFDVIKSRVYKLCPNTYELTYSGRPFWSPENRFIVLNVHDSKYYYCYCDAYEPFDLLIDTQQMRAYKLPTRKYHERLAWLAKP